MEKIKTSSLVENLGLLGVKMMIGVALCIFASLMHLQHTSILTSLLSVPVILTVKPPRLTRSSTLKRYSALPSPICKSAKKRKKKGIEERTGRGIGKE